MLQTVKVVLEITFENQTENHPANWDWPTLLDTPTKISANDEGVRLISAD